MESSRGFRCVTIGQDVCDCSTWLLAFSMWRGGWACSPALQLSLDSGLHLRSQSSTMLISVVPATLEGWIPVWVSPAELQHCRPACPITLCDVSVTRTWQRSGEHRVIPMRKHSKTSLFPVFRTAIHKSSLQTSWQPQLKHYFKKEQVISQ